MSKEIVVKTALVVWTESPERAEREESEDRYHNRPGQSSVLLGYAPLEVLLPAHPQWGGFAAGADCAARAAGATAGVLEMLAVVRALTSVSRWFERAVRQ